MTKDQPSPIRPTDDEARLLARTLLTEARFGALAVSLPDQTAPYVSRVATVAIEGAPHLLVSELSLHTKALTTHPDCSLLIGEPEDRGDPLTHPRMTLMARAEIADKASLKETWLEAIPKAKLYYDFTDFVMFRLTITKAHLNGGFGKAFHLEASDFAN
ncbi:hypothetical protein SAMN05444003_1732 [Cognatiyoonia sediminum]|uniref:CREG-like beta-barrel domain-containing protein n=1 Tax=Cognatiyoonia sediminum TaxID=1508389 RepID=A0A1M5PN04_9RHOB|nr:pyridoxamine 5-phosphate oxidase [Cognatiyoonia sediminum]SHH02959.1 hypothetical protein SAMN05444003_1732 [Cognatiyoonia sediminum]